MRPVTPLKTIFYDSREIEDVWKKQVWFWQRHKINRYEVLIDPRDHKAANDFLAQHQKSTALAGLCYQERQDDDLGSRSIAYRFAFVDRDEAMLFKLALGGEA